MARPTLVGAVGSGILCLVVAACGGSATPNPLSSSAAGAASEAPSLAAPSVEAPSVAPSEAAAASPGGSTGALPSINLPSDAKDLEALLPSTICGGTAVKASMNGDKLSSLNAGSGSDLVKALAALGKSPSDVSLAIAIGPTGDCNVGILRIKGVDVGLLQSAILAAGAQAGGTTTQTTVGGKSVFKTTGDGNATYIWFNNDSVVFASAKSDSDAASIIQAMP